MNEWKKTGCALCPQNCGLEVLVEQNFIVKVRPDKDNPRSQGYICRKGLNIAYYEHHNQRLSHPLKKTGSHHLPISWDQAITEIAEKLGSIREQHGPRSLAYLGGGAFGGQSEGAFGVRLLRALDSQYYYNPLGQELTGMYWAYGRMVGKQYNFTIPDHDRSDMLVAVGWNGWMSHQMPQARRFLDKFSKDPDKLLVVIDPRRSETAAKADIHLALRPGTDALLTRAMIALILQEGWQNQDYMEHYVAQFDQVKPWFENFNVRKACQVCELDFEQVKEVSRLFSTRKSSLHPDLGVLMGRHSTVTTYLEIILLAICGRLFVPGGNVVPGYLMTSGAHTDERDPKYWRTMVTDFPPILGVYPPNVLPEEIDNDHPERLRALIVSAGNPLRSFADTSAFEAAFDKLDLLVTIDVAMSETAALSDYVLPARTTFESWDTTHIQTTFPEIYLQMRRPILDADGEPWEGSAIFTALAEKLGLIPEIPEYLATAARSSRLQYAEALATYMKSNPKATASLPFVVAKTLGREMGSSNLAWLWAMLQIAPPDFYQNASRAGFKPGPTLGDDLFQAVLDHPEGLWLGESQIDSNFAHVRTEDQHIHLYIPEVESWVCSITPELEEQALQMDGTYPLILLAGRHMDMNANTMMRNPEWNQGRRACTLAMHPLNAERLGLDDGQQVEIITAGGRATIELEVTPSTRLGMVIIPHGFGLVFDGERYGVNVNQLTKNTHRDPIAGTPIHRYVPCRVEPGTPHE